MNNQVINFPLHYEESALKLRNNKNLQNQTKNTINTVETGDTYKPQNKKKTKNIAGTIAGIALATAGVFVGIKNKGKIKDLAVNLFKKLPNKEQVKLASNLVVKKVQDVKNSVVSKIPSKEQMQIAGENIKIEAQNILKKVAPKVIKK